MLAQKWAYWTLDIDLDDKKWPELGEAGWELVSAVRLECAGPSFGQETYLRLFFKKPLAGFAP